MTHVNLENQPAHGADDAAAICFRDVEVTFGRHQEHTVFSSIDLRVERGEFVVVVGRSGGGKTTLLNLLVGLIRPTSGTVRVVGKEPTQAKGHLALMMARDALLPWRSARRNVEFGLEIRGVDREERRRRSKEYLEKVHLGSAMNKLPWQLSQGMRQRVALARTWALQAEILLMDEPFSAVDAQTREMLQREFLDLWAQDRRTVLFITHDLHEAVLLADRIVVIGDGKILAERQVNLARPRTASALMHDAATAALLDELREIIAQPSS